MPKYSRLTYLYTILFSIALLTCGYLLGKFSVKTEWQGQAVHAIRQDGTSYKFIHPLLAIDRVDSDPTGSYQGLYKSINSQIESKINSKALDTASVYFIDYGKGGSFGINENQKYAPASLLKVIIMIGYLKKSESDPSILRQSFVYQESIAKHLDDAPFETPTRLKIGQSYTVAELIDLMIKDSDNGAMNMLLFNITDEYLNKVYTDLGLRAPTLDSSTYTISAKDYSLFFRILYNGTYLNDADSEKALTALSKTIFSDGLTAGLPTSPKIPIAHKWGEHVNGTINNVGSIELHDCGIIYYPNSPYLLCIMTKGKNYNDLTGTIVSISKMVYGYIDSHNK